MKMEKRRKLAVIGEIQNRNTAGDVISARVENGLCETLINCTVYTDNKFSKLSVNKYNGFRKDAEE